MRPDDSTMDLLAFHQSTRGLDEQQLHLIAASATTVRYRAGEVVYAAGSEVDALLLVIAGELEMSVSSASRADQPIQYMGRDDQFGFLAIHDAAPIPVTVTAMQDTVLIRIAKVDAIRLLQEVPLWRRNMMQSLGPRLRQAILNEKVRKRPRLVATIHAEDGPRDLTLSIAKRLSELRA